MSTFSANKIVTRRLEQSDYVNTATAASQTFTFSEIDTTNKTAGIGIHQTYDYSLSFAGNIQAAGKIRLLGKYLSGVNSKWFTVEYHFADAIVTWEDAINILPDQIEMDIVRTYSSPNTTLSIQVRHRLYTTLYFTTFVEGYAFKSIGNASTIAFGSDIFGNRGVFAGGDGPGGGAMNTIDYIAIDTPATTATDFGNLTQVRYGPGGTSDGSRGVISGGANPAYNIIDYITIATPGDAADFGDLTAARSYMCSCSDGSRGVNPGGNPYQNTIDYIEISILGNATDFGDTTVTLASGASTSDGSRGLHCGGARPDYTDDIEWFTISKPGNSSFFGDLTTDRLVPSACSDGSRGLIGAGSAPPQVKTIDYITIATPGNAADFGDLIAAASYGAAVSNGTIGCFAYGGNPYVDTIEYLTIGASPGSIVAVDFGNLSTSRGILAGLSGD